MEDNTNMDLAIAGGAVAMALLELLVTKGILSRAEGLGVLSAAQSGCGALKQNGAASVCATAYHQMRTEI